MKIRIFSSISFSSISFSSVTFSLLTLLGFSQIVWAQEPRLLRIQEELCNPPLEKIGNHAEYGPPAHFTDSAEEWVKKGVDLKFIDYRLRDRSNFVRKARLQGLEISETILFQDSPTEDVRVLKEAWDKTYRVRGADQFKAHFGFEPSEANFKRLEKLASGFPEYEGLPNQASFAPYTKSRKLSAFPAELPKPYADGYQGIAEFWNDPDAILQQMDRLKKRVAQRLADNPALPPAEALEQIRSEIEIAHGFLPQIRDNGELMTTKEWRAQLRTGTPMREPNGSHSLEYLAPDARNVHRNQWLTVMLEMDENPARFGNHPLKAGDLYRKMGESEWIEAMKLPSDSTAGAGQGILTNDIWFHLFDFVSQKGRFSNAANPLYFEELWLKKTDFRADW